MNENQHNKEPIASIASVISGYAFKRKDFMNKGIPVIKINNLNLGSIDFSKINFVSTKFLILSEKYHVHSGDILISLTGSHINQPNSVVGRVARFPKKAKKALLNQRVGKVIIEEKEKCEVAYLYYCLLDENTRIHISYLAHGAANQANVSPKQIESIYIYLPSLSTQRKIAAILSAYDDLIENNLRRIKILEEMAQALYREWFVHFRFPGHEKVHMVDSPLGKIPEGWEVKKLGEVLELNYGKALKQSERKGGAVPVFGSSGIVGYHNKALVSGPGIIVGRKGNVGSIFWSDSEFYPIDTVYYVSSLLPLRYLFFELQTKHFLSSDAAVPGLNRRYAYSLDTLIPSEELVHEFCGIIDSFYTQISVLQKKNDNLRKTRDLLLPKLISGEIDVSDLDIDTRRLEE